MTGYRALRVVSDAGVRVPNAYLATSISGIADAWPQVGAPAVVKLESTELAHKSDVGGVELGIGSPAELRDAAQRMSATLLQRAPAVPIEGFLVQSQVTGPAVECLVGIVRDPQVGLVMSIAPGGLLAELAGPAPTTPVPAAPGEIEYLIDSTGLARLLDGYRGAPRADRAALVQLVTRFSTLATCFGATLQAAELNPVMVLPAGQGAVAVDALIVTSDPATEDNDALPAARSQSLAPSMTAATVHS